MAWPTLATRTAYENPWIRVREDRVRRPDGAEGVYGVVELAHPAVFVVAVDDEDRVVLVTLDRHTTGPSVEVPAGGTDGQEPLEAARRELREETGLEAGAWERVGVMDALNGVCRAPEHVFLARDLRAAADDDPGARAEEGISRVRRVPFADALAMVRRGEIRDGETIAALALAALALGRLR